MSKEIKRLPLGGRTLKIQVDMRPFELSLGTLLLRYFLMMGLIIAGVFTQQYWLAILGFPVFLSAILGLSFSQQKSTAANVSTMPKRNTQQTQQAA